METDNSERLFMKTWQDLVSGLTVITQEKVKTFLRVWGQRVTEGGGGCQ